MQLRPAAGKVSRTERLVQRKGEGGGEEVAARAAEGVAGAGERLPFLDVISQSFGSHDVSGVQAHTGGAAQAAAADIGAQAYATGNDVAFAGTPDLHTAAHEAAHVVQQRAGVSLKGGVGEAGDAYEQHADRVADAVVQGKSAEGLLDQMAGRGGAGDHAVQKLGDEDAPVKKVGGDAMGRLGLAQKAITHTKQIFKFGAGNQMEAIRASNANSTIRMQIMRDEDNEYWDIAESVYELINDNMPAFTAAKGELMTGGGGGNCGEHADVAFDYLCVAGKGQNITVAQQKDFDHAFVLIGNLDSDTDAQIAVADAWPTRPCATLWEDHFAHCERKLVLRHVSRTADGSSAKNAIKAGLKLNAKGKAALTEKLSPKETEKLIKDGRKGDKPWIWNHADTFEPGREAEYQE